MMRWCMCVLMVLAACGAQKPRVTITEGEDYTLPAWVAVDTYTGYGSGSPGGRIIQKNWHISWRTLEPERGKYNWDLVEQELADAKAGGYQLNMHLTGIVVGGIDPARNNAPQSNNVPDWVFKVFKAPTDTLGWRFNLRVIPGWRPDIRDAFNALVREFGKKGYPAREELGAAYIHGISLSRGEEFNLPPQVAARLEKTLGLSPAALRDWITTRIDAFADAFAGYEYKLCWVGSTGIVFAYGAYDGIAMELLQHAWAKGAGNRGGGIEWYNEYINHPAWGQSVDPGGYILTDETIPPIATVRFFGEENEEYGDYWPWRWGPVEEHPHRYRMAMLRALQVRFRFLWTSDAAETMNPPLSEYARYSFGKTIETTPDAWAYLREMDIPDAYQGKPGPIKNIERWLIQRDVPGGMTVRTEYTPITVGIHSYANRPELSERQFEYAARRTDIASGNSVICFNLDDRFKVQGAGAIKVEVLCNSNAAWHLEYQDPSGRTVQSDAVQLPNDGAVRTVSFAFDQAKFANGMDHVMDFRVVCDGPEDLTVTWVRVVRQQLL